jgi:hypothetical protein
MKNNAYQYIHNYSASRPIFKRNLTRRSSGGHQAKRIRKEEITYARGNGRHATASASQFGTTPKAYSELDIVMVCVDKT